MIFSSIDRDSDASSRTSNSRFSRARRRALAIRPLERMEDRALMATLYGLTNVNTLLKFDSSTPGTIQSTIPLTGIGAGEKIEGIDFRPANGVLYALTDDPSNVGRIYAINVTSGAASAPTVLAADPADATSPYTALSGTSFGVDFNPVPDRLRVTSDTGQNLRINVDTGLVTTDTTLNGAATGVTGSAYSNDFKGATTTTLYAIDPISDTLLIQNPPNNGTLTTVGALGVNTSSAIGFDIQTSGEQLTPSQTAYATLTVGGNTGLYTINLATGAATLVGPISSVPTTIQGLAVAPDLSLVPAANAIALTTGNVLSRFNTAAPSVITSTTTITGLREGETILGIDYRPANAVLYGLGDSGRIYSIDPASGAVTGSVVLAADPNDQTNPFTGLSGSSFGVDFNPVSDRFRVTSNTGQNLSIDVSTGLVTTAPNLTPVNAGVGGSAYINSYPGSGQTALYDIDATNGTLVTQNLTDGSLTTVGSLGVQPAGALGFDIRAANNVAIAALNVGNSGNLYTVNLASGAASLVGPIGSGTQVLGLAIIPNGTLNFSVSNYTVNEGMAFATITVNRIGGSDGAVSATYTTSAGTAVNGQNYSDVTGTVTFADGDTTPKTFQIPILNDGAFTPVPNLTVNLALSNPTGGAVLGALPTSQLRIIDSTPRSLSIDSVTVDESAGTATVTVRLDAASGNTITTVVNTADGTAVAGSDYTAVGPITLTFAPGVTTQTFSIPILDDGVTEKTESFSAILSNASNALIAQAVSTITIIDNDTPVVGSGKAVSVVEAQPFSGVVAAFNDPDGTQPLSTYTASIDWGDGTPATAGTITVSNNAFAVSGTHTYFKEGTYPTTVIVTKRAQVTTVLYSTASVADGAISVAINPLTPSEGIPFQAIVATFADGGGLEAISSYFATIDWGDGTPVAPGQVVSTELIPRDLVNSTHTYAAPGQYNVGVTVRSQGGSVATQYATITVGAATPFLSGILNPASDSGASNSDKITNVRQPNFLGFSVPNSTIRLFAQAPGGTPFQIGQGGTDTSGAYSITVTQPLADGAYTITATSTAANGAFRSSATILPANGSGPLVIDTVGPQVTDVRFNRLTGTILVGLRDDRSGLDRTTVLDGSNYLLTKPHTFDGTYRLSNITAPAVGATDLETVTLVYNGGVRKLPHGIYTFRIRSGGIADIAGNALDGEFTGAFPSGNDRPGGDFVASITAYHRLNFAPVSLTGGVAPTTATSVRATPSARTAVRFLATHKATPQTRAVARVSSHPARATAANRFGHTS